MVKIKNLFFTLLGLLLITIPCNTASKSPSKKKAAASTTIRKKLNYRQREKARKSSGIGEKSNDTAATIVPGIATSESMARKTHRLSLILDLSSLDVTKADASGMFDILYQIHQQASPIILTGNYFKAFSEYKKAFNTKYTDDLKKSIVEATSAEQAYEILNLTYSNPEYASLFWMSEELSMNFFLVDFSNLNWVCYKHNTADFILLIPKKIITESTTSQNPQQQLQACGFNPKNLTQLSSVLPPDTEIPELGRPDGFTPELKKMFLPLKDDPSFWHIASSGHGMYGSTNGLSDPSKAQISGIPMMDFNQLISFFNGTETSDINVQFFYYLGCFSAGSNLSFVNDQLKAINANFMIATRGMNESVTFSDSLIFQKDDGTGYFHLAQATSFPDFFARLEDFFGQRSIKGDPIRYILEPLHKEVEKKLGAQSKNMQAFIRIPKVGTFNAVKASDDVAILTKGIVRAHELEGKPFDFSSSTRTRILNCAQRVDVPIILTKPQTVEQKSLILQLPPITENRPYARLYIFEEIFNENQNIPDFIAQLSTSNASFLPITILIKKIHRNDGYIVKNLLIFFKANGRFDARSYLAKVNLQHNYNSHTPLKTLAQSCLTAQDYAALQDTKADFDTNDLVFLLDKKLEKGTIGGLNKVGDKQARLTSMVTRLEASVSNANLVDYQLSKSYSIEGFKQMLLQVQQGANNLLEQIEPTNPLQSRTEKLLAKIHSLLEAVQTVFLPIEESITKKILPELAIKIVLYLIQHPHFLKITKNRDFIQHMLEGSFLDGDIGTIWHTLNEQPRTDETKQTLSNMSITILKHCIGKDEPEGIPVLLEKIQQGVTPIDRNQSCLVIMEKLVANKKAFNIASSIAQATPVNIYTIFPLSKLYLLLTEEQPAFIEKALFFAFEAASKISAPEPTVPMSQAIPQRPGPIIVSPLGSITALHNMALLSLRIINHYQSVRPTHQQTSDTTAQIKSIISWIKRIISIQKQCRPSMIRELNTLFENTKQIEVELSAKVALLNEATITTP